MMHMHAFELRQFNTPLVAIRRPLPEPGRGEARIRVQACGVCGSDLFLQKGGFARPLPVIPGHEAAGTIDALGPETHGWHVGEQVALYYISTPADDVFSARGVPNRSPRLQRMGVDVDGAFADFVVRPVSTLVRPTRYVPPPTLAVLTDAVGTPLHALKRVARASANETVVVLGIGGIGSAAIGIAKALGARVIAIARSPAKQQLALRLGADEAPLAVEPDAALAAVRHLTGGLGPDIVLQCAGSARQDELAITMGGPGARVVLIGASPDSFALKATDLIWRELTVMGSRGFVPADIEDAIDLYLSARLDVSHLVANCRPLSEANTALDDLRTGRVLRSVLIP